MGSAPEELEPEDEDRSHGLVARTEQLADLAIGKLKKRIQIQTIQQDVSRTANLLGTLESFSLRLIVAIFLIASLSGIVLVVVGNDPVGRLPDWYLHVAMYIVIFVLVLLYIRAYQQRRPVRRLFYSCLSLVALMAFAWILHDRIPARSLMVQPGDLDTTHLRSVVRGRMEGLWAPIILLLLTAVGLLLHQLFVRRKPPPDDHEAAV